MNLENFEMYAKLGAGLQQELQRAQSLLDGHLHRLNAESFTGTDEAKTVAATINARQRLTGLYIQEGLKRLGPETVARRINEAIADARTAMAAANGAPRQLVEQLAESFGDFPGSLRKYLA